MIHAVSLSRQLVETGVTQNVQSKHNTVDSWRFELSREIDQGSSYMDF